LDGFQEAELHEHEDGGEGDADDGDAAAHGLMREIVPGERSALGHFYSGISTSTWRPMRAEVASGKEPPRSFAASRPSTRRTTVATVRSTGRRGSTGRSVAAPAAVRMRSLVAR